MLSAKRKSGFIVPSKSIPVQEVMVESETLVLAGNERSTEWSGALRRQQAKIKPVAEEYLPVFPVELPF